MLTCLAMTISPARKTFGEKLQSASLTAATKSTSQFASSLHQSYIRMSPSHSDAAIHTLTIDQGGGRGVRSNDNGYKQAYMEGVEVSDLLEYFDIGRVIL